MTEAEKLQRFNAMRKDTLLETLDIEYTACGDDWLEAKMPVTQKHLQPMGLLHGGATVALAETVGSAASWLFLKDPETQAAVGLEIAANHVRSARLGETVYGKAQVLHAGRTTQVFEIRITNEEGKLISFVKMTNAIVSRAHKVH